MRTLGDTIAEAGYLALGTRLKRLAEQLQAGVAEILAEQKCNVAPGQLPLLASLDRRDGLTIAQLVQALGVSQPAVSRMAGALERGGLIVFESDLGDARLRRARLTQKSRTLLNALRTSLFPSVAAAAEELCQGLGLLESVSVIERRNRQLSFANRIRKAKR